MRKQWLPLFSLGILLAALLCSFNIHKTSTSFSILSDTSLPVFKAKDHKAKTVVSSRGVITFTTGLENDFYQADSNRRTAYLYLDVKLASLLNAPVKRNPLNISIVIDRSGSMQGIKMGYAKKAAKAIIDQLLPTDYVSVVIYDNTIDNVQEPVLVSNKEQIKSRIDGITPRGSTNLWGGTERGYDFVKKNYNSSFVNRVLLISDGIANTGLTDSSQIRKNVQRYKDVHGITISTFGVGLDYNEELMTDMAETGSGNYYFIDAPGSLVDLFNKELNSLLRIVAQNAVIKIKIPEGVQIEKTYSLKYTQVDDVVMIRLLDLFSAETKSNLFKLKLDDKLTKPLKVISTLSYTDVLDGQEKSLTNENLVAPVKNNDTYLTHFNKPVLEQAILFNANENLERAMTEADKGNYVDANKYLALNAAYLQGNAIYVSNSTELKKMDSANRKYQLFLSNLKNLSSDSVKKLQKFSRQDSYKLRNKKN